MSRINKLKNESIFCFDNNEDTLGMVLSNEFHINNIIMINIFPVY